MTEPAATICGNCVELTEQLAAANRELDHVARYLADDEDGQTHRLASFVRWYHDREHAQHNPWSVCPHEMCREAGRYV